MPDEIEVLPEEEPIPEPETETVTYDPTSILSTIKIQLGIVQNCTSFDPILIPMINSVFLSLKQLGIGPEAGYRIGSEADKWDSYIPDEEMMEFESVKTYIYLKTKMIFDPPSSAAVMAAYKEMIQEAEWRLRTLVEDS